MITSDDEFKTKVALLYSYLERVGKLLTDILVLAFEIGEFLDEAVPKGSHQKRWIINAGLAQRSSLIKACGSIFRRTHHNSETPRIETWKLHLLGIVSSIHHAVKPKSKKPGKRPPELFLYHLGRTRENLTKLQDSVNMTPEIKQEIKRQIDSIKESL